MLREASEVQVGRIVHLYPHTKQASRNVHRMLAVTVSKDPTAHWPMVLVTWKEDGVDMWEMVHKDNIKLKSAGARTKADDRAGDTTRDGGNVWASVKKMRGGLPGNAEVQEETLF